jgi:hypothetical protein
MNDSSKTYRQKAIETAAKALLDRWDVVKENDNLIDALKESIGLGGGQSFLKEIGPYWHFDYEPGIKISLWRINKDCRKLSYQEKKYHGFPEDYNLVIHDEITRKEFLSYAREIWNTKKFGQQKLF